MATISIKDLPESVDLDRQAMLAISGGARVRGRSAPVARSLVRSTRIIDYPAGFGSSLRRPAATAGKPPGRNQPA